jgi:hypothetical protein
MRDRRSTQRGLCLPATFRPQGLVTLSAAYALRARAGFVSHRQRSWDSPFGAFSSRKVPAAFPRGWTHMPFLPSVFPPPKRRAGPTGRGSWALTLAGVPDGRTRVSRPAAGCSHGLHPSKVLQRAALLGPSPKLLPRAFAATSLATSRRRRPGVSIGSRLAPPSPPGKPDGGWDNPLRVLAPVRSRPFERCPCPGYGFTSRRAAHCCQLAADLWAGDLALPESLGSRLRCRRERRLAPVLPSER